MRSTQYKSPKLFARHGGELPLSGAALLALMQAVLARGVPFRFCARGWSMAPFIQDGDVITVRPVMGRVPGVGAVVAFIHPESGRLVVHRVVRRGEVGVLILGDNDPACTEVVVPEDNLLGRVTRIARDGRRVWLGLGPERLLIAWLSRLRWLTPLQARLAAWRKRFSGGNSA